MNVILIELPSQVGAVGVGPETYIGAHVAGAGFAQALMEFGRLDRLVVYAPASRRQLLATRLASYSASDQVQLMDDTEIRETFGSDDRVVIQTLGPSLWRGMHLRWLCGPRPWPVIGITYTLSDLSVYRELMLTLMGKLQPYDAIACVTECARDVAQRMLTSATLGCAETAPSLPCLPVIPLGVDTRQFTPLSREQARRTLGLPQDATIFLYLGRLSSCDKADLSPLLQAFAGVDEISLPLLVIAGSASGESAIAPLKFRCAELGLTESVRWCVNVAPEQRQELLSAADVFVSPVDSLQESFGLTLLEAMACGLPVIAADWNGYREIVDVPSTGILVRTLLVEDLTHISQRAPLEDNAWLHWELGQAAAIDVADLTAAMVNLIRDPELRRRMGEAARQRACELFDWSRVVCAFQDEWAKLDSLARNSAPYPSSPYWYDYGDVFSGHPSARLKLTSIVRSVTSATTLPPPVVSPPPFLNPAMLAHILRLLKTPTVIASLPGGPARALQHVAYLVKQGLVQEEEL